MNSRGYLDELVASQMNSGGIQMILLATKMNSGWWLPR